MSVRVQRRGEGSGQTCMCRRPCRGSVGCTSAGACGPPPALPCSAASSCPHHHHPHWTTRPPSAPEPQSFAAADPTPHPMVQAVIRKRHAIRSCWPLGWSVFLDLSVRADSQPHPMVSVPLRTVHINRSCRTLVWPGIGPEQLIRRIIDDMIGKSERSLPQDITSHQKWDLLSPLSRSASAACRS